MMDRKTTFVGTFNNIFRRKKSTTKKKKEESCIYQEVDRLKEVIDNQQLEIDRLRVELVKRNYAQYRAGIEQGKYLSAVVEKYLIEELDMVERMYNYLINNKSIVK